MELLRFSMAQIERAVKVILKITAMKKQSSENSKNEMSFRHTTYTV